MVFYYNNGKDNERDRPMEQINWNQFKIFKQAYPNQTGLDNFQLLLHFILSVDKLISPNDILEMLTEDVLAQQMLEKRGITDSFGLEEYLYKLFHQ
jgi:hypothetical protein